MKEFLPKEYEAKRLESLKPIEIDLNKILAGTHTFPIPTKKDHFKDFHEKNKKEDMMKQFEEEKERLKKEYENKILNLSAAVN